MKISSKILWTLILGSILILSFSCGDDDDDATLSDTSSGGGGGSDADADDDAADDDTGDDDTGDDDTADDDTTDDDADYPIIAFIYNSYPGVVTGLIDLVDSFGGFDYVTIDESLAQSADFGDAALIVVTPDTKWYEADSVDRVLDLGLPVLALGEGGLTLYAQGDMATGWYGDGTIYDYDDTAIVEDAGHDIFQGPHSVTISDTQINLFAESVVLYAVPTYQFDSDVDLLASSYWNDERGAIQLERDRFMSWGYEFVADDMSSNGASLLMNCIEFLVD